MFLYIFQKLNNKNMNNKTLLTLSAIAMFLLQLSCTTQPPTDLTKTAFIPKPVSVTATGKSFDFSDLTTIYFQEGKDELKATGQYLAEYLNRIADIEPEVRPTSELPRKGIYLSVTDNDSELGNEGYDITISKRLIAIKANGNAGCFYAVQTLLQTLPVESKPGQPLLRLLPEQSAIFRNTITVVPCSMLPAIFLVWMM